MNNATALSEINCPTCRQSYNELSISADNGIYTISCPICNAFTFTCNSGLETTIQAFYDKHHINPYGRTKEEGSWWLTKYGKRLAPFKNLKDIDNIIDVQNTLIRIEHFQLAP